MKLSKKALGFAIFSALLFPLSASADTASLKEAAFILALTIAIAMAALRMSLAAITSALTKRISSTRLLSQRFTIMTGF